jgi:hypothetical protein
VGEVRKEELLASFRNASSVRVLKFLGSLMKVHKQHNLEHTLDEQFMSECRRLYEERLTFFLENEDGEEVRQQPAGDHQRQRPQGKKHAPGLQGDMRDQQPGVLDFGMDQRAQRRIREIPEFEL